jgi:hypothetical protein
MNIFYKKLEQQFLKKVAHYFFSTNSNPGYKATKCFGKWWKFMCKTFFFQIPELQTGS